jgi:hypothetical protein
VQPAPHPDRSRGADAASPFDQLAHGLAAGEHVVHWNGSTDDPATAAGELLAEATGSRPQEPLFVFAAYLLHLRTRSERLVVVIDDLDAMPPRLAQWLRAALDSSDGTLRALASAADDAAAERATARLGLVLVRPRRPAPSAESQRWWLGVASVALGAVVALAAFLSVNP